MSELLDAGLQDQPDVLLEMSRFLLKEKVDVIYGVRASRRETKFKEFFYFVFCRLYLETLFKLRQFQCGIERRASQGYLAEAENHC